MRGFCPGRVDCAADCALCVPPQLSNLVDRFGETCELVQFSRTIEGDCNNLVTPRAGAANHQLKRLPFHDPSFGDGISSPGGAKHISPREISNVIFAESKQPTNRRFCGRWPSFALPVHAALGVGSVLGRRFRGVPKTCFMWP